MKPPLKIIKSICRDIIYRIPSSYVLMFHHVTLQPLIKQSGCMLDTNKFYEIINKYDKYASLLTVISNPSINKIAITFDDGLEDLYTIAYPFLKKRNIPFTIFIITDFLDKPGYITTEQLKKLSCDPLVTIGSHGVSHNIFTKMSYEEKKEELEKSKFILEKIINKDVVCFAYSHGQYDDETLDLVKIYDFAMSVIERPINRITLKNKWLVPRFNIEEERYNIQKAFLDKYII